MEFSCATVKNLEGVPDYVMQSALSWGDKYRIVERIPAMLTVEGICKERQTYFPRVIVPAAQVDEWDFFFDRERNRLIVVFGRPSCDQKNRIRRNQVHKRVLEKAFYYAFFSNEDAR